MKLSLSIALIFISANAFCAQADTTKSNRMDTSIESNEYRNSFRAIVGIGNNWSLNNKNGIYTIGFIDAYNINIHTLSARIILSINDKSAPKTAIIDYGFLYGVGVCLSDYYFNISGGLENVNKITWNDPEIGSQTINSSVFGFAYQFQASYSIWESFGIGFLLFGDVNSIFSHVGGLIFLQARIF